MQPDAGGRARAPRRWRTATLGFVASLGMTDGPYGRYRYAAGSTEPTLDSSTYAAMTRDLYGDLATLSTAEREAWIAYLQSHQDDDGLFRNPVIFDQGWYAGDRESSACEDIDSIDPPARLLAHGPPHRRDDIRTALTRGAEVVLAAQAADGGFQFVRGRPFEYGRPQLADGSAAEGREAVALVVRRTRGARASLRPGLRDDIPRRRHHVDVPAGAARRPPAHDLWPSPRALWQPGAGQHRQRPHLERAGDRQWRRHAPDRVVRGPAGPAPCRPPTGQVEARRSGEGD